MVIQNLLHQDAHLNLYTVNIFCQNMMLIEEKNILKQQLEEG